MMGKNHLRLNISMMNEMNPFESEEEVPRPPDPPRRTCLLEDIPSPPRPRQRRSRRLKKHRVEEDVNVQWDMGESAPLTEPILSPPRPSVFHQLRQEEEYEEQLERAIQASLEEIEHGTQEQQAEHQKFRFGLVRSRLHFADPIEKRWIERIDWVCTPVYRRPPWITSCEEDQKMREWYQKRQNSPVYKILGELWDT